MILRAPVAPSTPNFCATISEPNIIAITKIHWKIAAGIEIVVRPDAGVFQPGFEVAQKALGLSLPVASKIESDRYIKKT